MFAVDPVPAVSGLFRRLFYPSTLGRPRARSVTLALKRSADLGTGETMVFIDEPASHPAVSRRDD
jgi:hypothetical protein